MLRIGSRTKWGVVAAIGTTGGECYYWMVKKNLVAMMPAAIVEPADMIVEEGVQCR